MAWLKLIESNSWSMLVHLCVLRIALYCSSYLVCPNICFVCHGYVLFLTRWRSYGLFTFESARPDNCTQVWCFYGPRVQLITVWNIVHAWKIEVTVWNIVQIQHNFILPRHHWVNHRCTSQSTAASSYDTNKEGKIKQLCRNIVANKQPEKKCRMKVQRCKMNPTMRTQAASSKKKLHKCESMKFFGVDKTLQTSSSHHCFLSYSSR